MSKKIILKILPFLIVLPVLAGCAPYSSTWGYNDYPAYAYQDSGVNYYYVPRHRYHYYYRRHSGVNYYPVHHSGVGYYPIHHHGGVNYYPVHRAHSGVGYYPVHHHAGVKYYPVHHHEKSESDSKKYRHFASKKENKAPKPNYFR